MDSRILLASTGALVIGLLAPFALKPWLRKMGVVDRPSARSSHVEPTTRGGGIAVAAALTAGLAIASLLGADSVALLMVIVISLTVAIIGWLEDRRGLPIALRAALQLGVGVALAVMAVVNGAPYYLAPLVVLFLVGIVNVANFMDGVNGLSSLSGATIGIFFSITGVLYEVDWLIIAGAVLAAALLSFLPWNLLGSRLFLGDVGSYLVGGAFASIVTLGVVSGVHPLALIAPLCIYLADTLTTFLIRLLSGERWYESHRRHSYHQLEDLGATHLAVAFLVAGFSAVTAVFGLIGSIEPALLGPGIVAIAIVIGVYLVLPPIGRRARASGAVLSSDADG